METNQQDGSPDTGVVPAEQERRDPTRAAEISPTIGRGGNVVVVAPPSPGYLEPALSSLKAAEAPGLRLLILTAEAMLDAVELTLAEASTHKGTVVTGRAPDRVADLLDRDRIDTLVISPENAQALQSRSSLPLDRAPTVLLAWPETWEDQAPLLGIMQDLPPEAQRLLFTADPQLAEQLGERYLRKALVVGTSGHRSVQQVPRVTVAAVHDRALGPAVRGTLDQLGSSAVVWTATKVTRSRVEQAVRQSPHDVTVVRGSIPKANLVIAADLPSPGDLVQLSDAARRLVILAPVWGLPYLGRHAGALDPFAVSGGLDRSGRLARQRATISQAIDQGGADLDRAVHALGPLLEQHDPVRVAGALYRLWTADQPEPVPGPGTGAAATIAAGTRPPRKSGGRPARVFVTAGKKDGATPADFVAILTKDLKVPREHVGKIDLRETYSLIELPADEAQAVADALTGQTIRKRKVVARLDRQR